MGYLSKFSAQQVYTALVMYVCFCCANPASHCMQDFSLASFS